MQPTEPSPPGRAHDIVRYLRTTFFLFAVVSFFVGEIFTQRFVETVVKGGRAIDENNIFRVHLFQNQLFFLAGFFLLIFLLILFFHQTLVSFVRRHKALLVNMLVSLCMILLLLVFMEGMLRLFFVHSLDLEYGSGPGMRKFLGTLSFNQEGFRDREWGVQKDPLVYRIAVLGDSFTFGVGILNESDRFPELLESLFSSTDLPRRVEIMNFGRRGYSTQDELFVLTNVTLAYHPDMLLLAYYLNDPETTESREQFLRKFNFHFVYPFELGDYLYRHSYAYYFFESRLKNIFSRIGLLTSYDDYISYLYSDNNPFLQDHLRDVRNIFLIAQKHQIRPVLLIIPAINHVRTQTYPFARAHEVIGDLCKETHVSCIDMLPFFQQASIVLTLSSMDSHLNEAGNKIIAQVLYDKFISEKFFSTA